MWLILDVLKGECRGVVVVECIYVSMMFVVVSVSVVLGYALFIGFTIQLRGCHVGSLKLYSGFPSILRAGTEAYTCTGARSIPKKDNNEHRMRHTYSVRAVQRILIR